MKWYWKILIGLIVLLVIGFFSIDYVATNIVKSKVETLKNQVKDDFDFDFKSLQLSLVNRTVVLRDFEFYTIVDSTLSTNKYDLKLDKLYVKYATFADIFYNRSIDIVEVVLNHPEISFGIKTHKKKEVKVETADVKDDAVEEEASFFEKINMGEIKIESAKVDLYDLEQPDNKLVFVNDLDLYVPGYVIDLVKDSFYISTDSPAKVLLSLKEIYKNDLKKHNLSIDEMQYFFDTKEFKISNITFENKESPEEFRKTLSHRSPWFSIKVPEIKVKINPREVYDTGILHLPKIEITDAEVTISNDLNFPIKPGHKAMPGTQIKSANMDLLLDSLLISNAKLEYYQKAKAAESGLFKLSEINALALRVTDIDSLIAANPFMDMSVNTTLWDEGKMNVNFRFDLSSPNDRVDVSGSLKNMAVKQAEKMIKPLYGVEVESGYIDLLAFNFTMDENMSKGKLKFDYKDLKVDLKAKDKDQKEENDEVQYTEKSIGILNFAVGQATRDNNQPGDKNYIEEGNIIVDRTKFKPVFDLLWNSVANGLMDIVIKDAIYDSKKHYEKKSKKEEKAAKKNQEKKSN